MKKNILFGITIVFIVVASCRRNHIPSMAEDKMAGHRIIAILPAEIIYTGSKPKNVTETDITKMEESESKMFQQFLHDNILRDGNTTQYTLTVSVQNYINTLALLTDNKISIRDSWYKTDEELVKLLNVDAVVRMKVQLKRYMSDKASMGIDYGRQIVGAVLKKNIYIPSKTNDVIASCSLVSKGETLWNKNYRREADWDTPADYVVNNITRNFAYYIPYKHRR
jgi:hypothetical protein